MEVVQSSCSSEEIVIWLRDLCRVSVVGSRRRREVGEDDVGNVEDGKGRRILPVREESVS